MILTVTINPLLERRYYYPSVQLSSPNRNGKRVIKAGGKGINVSRQLNKLGVKNIALLFTGGNNGKLIRESLQLENINFTDIKTKSETRDGTVIIDQSNKNVQSFFGTSSELTSSEVDSFILKMEKMISICEIVVFSGSSPCSAADNIFPEGIRIANNLDKISVCDTYGIQLNNCLNASPTVIHNNVDEIKSSLGIKLDEEKDYNAFLNHLYDKGIKQAFITDAEKPFYGSNFDFHYKVSLPKIDAADSTGSGDAFTAGIIYGWHEKFTFEQQLRFASALGVCNAKSFEVCVSQKQDAELIVEQIKIISIGKKLKQTNDLPG